MTLIDTNKHVVTFSILKLEKNWKSAEFRNSGISGSHSAEFRIFAKFFNLNT